MVMARWDLQPSQMTPLSAAASWQRCAGSVSVMLMAQGAHQAAWIRRVISPARMVERM
jgi:hypothetical protein